MPKVALRLQLCIRILDDAVFVGAATSAARTSPVRCAPSPAAMPVLDKSIEEIIKGASDCEVVLRKRRQSENDSFVEDIRSILEKEHASLAREADSKDEADEADSDVEAAPAAADEAKSVRWLDEAKDEAKDGDDDSRSDAKSLSDDAKSLSDDAKSLSDDDDDASAWSDDGDFDDGGGGIAATSGISANLLALLGGAAPKAAAAPAAEPRRSQLQAGIFRAAGTWTPPARSGLDNSVNLLSGR